MPVRIDHDSRGVVTAWLDNAARRNAMDDGMLAALAGLLEDAERAAATRVVAIRGMHGCFCSGRDLGALGGDDGDPASRLAPIARLAQAFRQCSVPVVAVVEGKAAGLGVSLACWSDVAIAARGAAFSLPEARAGIAPSVTTVSLIEAIGKRQALDLCLTGRSIDADSAVRIGLVQSACALQDIPAELEAVLRNLLKGAPGALRLTKQLARAADGLPFDAALGAALATAQRSLAGGELAEGLAALRDKRLPSWQRAAGLSIDPAGARQGGSR